MLGRWASTHVWVAGVVGQAHDGSIPADVVAQFDLAITVMDKDGAVTSSTFDDGLPHRFRCGVAIDHMMLSAEYRPIGKQLVEG